MLLIKAIKKLKENLDELPTDNIQYKMGYATAIRDLRHIAEEEEEGDRRIDDGKEQDEAGR